MQYHVSGTWIEVGALLPPEQVGPMLEHAVIPSLELLAQWVEQGKISGGVFPGERETAFILNASSPEEVGQLLSSLPFWGMMKWQVRPLQSIRSAVEREKEFLNKMSPPTG
jgi:muconolactone delta-isomerase